MELPLHGWGLWGRGREPTGEVRKKWQNGNTKQQKEYKKKTGGKKTGLRSVEDQKEKGEGRCGRGIVNC